MKKEYLNLNSYMRYRSAMDRITDLKIKKFRPLNIKEYNKIIKDIYGPDVFNPEDLKDFAFSYLDQLSLLESVYKEKIVPYSKIEQIFLDESFKCIMNTKQFGNDENTWENFAASLLYKDKIIDLIEFGIKYKVRDDYINMAKEILNDSKEIFNMPYKVKSLNEYDLIYHRDYSLIEKYKSGDKILDLSEMEISFSNIIYVDIENLNLTIDLNKLETYDYSFLDLSDTSLKGNNIKGDLNPKNGVKILYNEDTFDEIYKREHPEFFLSSDAPDELKKIYYIYNYRYNIENRIKLDFETYLKYYNYLKGKSLVYVHLDEKDSFKIRLINIFGLEESLNIIKNLCDINLPIEYLLVSLSKMNNDEILYYFSNSFDGRLEKNDIFLNEYKEKILKKLNK